MKIFLAVSSADIVKYFYDRTHKKINIMISYQFLEGNAYKLTHDYRKMIKSLYLDSGAYSVFTGKSNMTVYEYKNYIDIFGKEFDQTFSFDSNFFDPEQNWLNQIYLEKDLPEGLKRPIPVIHESEKPLDEIEQYSDDGHEYIALASNNRGLKPKTYEEIKKKFPDTKFHCFGNLNRKVLEDFRPYSADSATFIHHSAHGCFYYWDPEEEKEYTIYVGARDRVLSKNELHLKGSEKSKQLEEFLDKTFGFALVHI